MACGCQKNQAKQAESAAARSSRAAANQAAQTAKATSTPALSTTARVPAMQGGSQSFSLNPRAERTQSFRSPLEDRAARMRRGGTSPAS
jgi:hypothetical protein